MTVRFSLRARGEALAVAACAWVIVGAAVSGASGYAQTPPDLARAITALGDFSYQVRAEASRVVRRTDAGVVVPALLEAARTHPDSYVQFRAAVILSGYPDPRVDAYFREALESLNDRVRAVAYEAAAYRPDPSLALRLLGALEQEASEFVRPQLIRALAAHSADPAVRGQLTADVNRGESAFRSAVIEALGDQRAAWAVEQLLPLASEEGPLRDDALLALGKIGDERALRALAGTAVDPGNPDQPIVSATTCLLGVDCRSQVDYVVGTLKYGASGAGDDPELLRAASSAAAALAMAGHAEALDGLLDAGVGAGDPGRAPIALALGTVALRTPERALETIVARGDLEDVLLLLRDAFDMLDEDLAEERFYVLLRDLYWANGQSGQVRAAVEKAMEVLEF